MTEVSTFYITLAIAGDKTLNHMKTHPKEEKRLKIHKKKCFCRFTFLKITEACRRKLQFNMESSREAVWRRQNMKDGGNTTAGEFLGLINGMPFYIGNMSGTICLSSFL